ncbi:MAG: (d)CMP kinase [Coriobacteriia bacterium]
MIVAIDGPAGSGKSTVAKALAKRLGFHYLDTGAMYRSVTLEALRRCEDVDCEAVIANVARNSAIEFRHDADAAIPNRVLLSGEDVTLAIRTPEVDANVSAVARLPRVREALVSLQREVGIGRDLVAEGRDIGTVVFPDAEVKIYLTASTEERGRRRHLELEERGEVVQRDEVRDKIIARDHLDSSRETAPLTAAADAHVLDTTDMGIDEVVDLIAGLIEAAR